MAGAAATAVEAGSVGRREAVLRARYRSNRVPHVTAADGANGSSGGSGGQGGGGAGGSGGPSICVFYKGIAPTTNGLMFTTGSVGQGGAGGQGMVQAQPGPSGVSGTPALRKFRTNASRRRPSRKSLMTMRLCLAIAAFLSLCATADAQATQARWRRHSPAARTVCRVVASRPPPRSAATRDRCL